MLLIERPRCPERLIRLVGTPNIKVITGVRRAGKSKLLEAARDYHLRELHGASVIHVDLSLLEFEELTECHALNTHVTSHYVEGTRNFVLIDEVQMCEGFERTINSLHASGSYDIYITGSNAFLLSSDLATLFTGRTVSVKVSPFSFEEYRSCFEGERVDNALERYLRMGGMPGSYVYADERDRHCRTLIISTILAQSDSFACIRSPDIVIILTIIRTILGGARWRSRWASRR